MQCCFIHLCTIKYSYMKTFLKISIFILITLSVFLLGPRPQWNAQITKVNLPKDLDKYLIKEESKHQPLKKNTDKKIFWKYKDKRKTKYSVIYFHGYTSSRYDLNPVINQVADALDANLYVARLAGHGSSDPDGKPMGLVKANDWLKDGEEGYQIGKQIGENVIAVGISTGCTIIHTIANRHKELHSMIFLSPNFHPADPGTKLLTGPWAEMILPFVEGEYRQWEPYNDFQKQYWTHRYPSKTLIQMMLLVEYSLSIDPGKIKTPLKIIYVKEDTVVSIPMMHERFKLYASNPKEMKDLEEAWRHTIAGDISPEFNDPLKKEILKFLKPLSP
jgi:esterase/lipase